MRQQATSSSRPVQLKVIKYLYQYFRKFGFKEHVNFLELKMEPTLKPMAETPSNDAIHK